MEAKIDIRSYLILNIYFILVLILFLIECLYIEAAKYFNIFDQPNYRSSHFVKTIKGGGVLIPISIVFLFFYSGNYGTLVICSSLLGIISFVNDIKSIKPFFRLICHIIFVTIAFYDLSIYLTNFYLFIPLIVIYVGWINGFNFMDGINGISVIYSLTTLASIFLIYDISEHLDLIIFLGLALIVFGFFNIRKNAILFLGDVGSVTIAFIIGYLITYVIYHSGNWEYILVLSVYGIDVSITLIERMILKENIFKPHRKHLYQILANELGYPHIIVTFLYSVIQFIFNLILFDYLNSDKNLNYIIIYIFSLIVFYIAAKLIAKKY